MTTLAAIQGDGWVVMGCDSRASDEGGRVMDLATPKIVINGDYMIAVSGASRGGNIAQFGWTPPKPPNSTNRTTLDKFVTKKLIPSLRDAFIKAGYEGKEDGESAWQDSNLLVAFNGVIYPIFNDYSWDREVRNIYYSGSGGDVALGALVALNIERADTPEKAERIVYKAVEIATKWDAYCSPPIITMIQYEQGKQMSVKGEKYKSKSAMMKHEKTESPAMRMKEYGKKKAAKKAVAKKKK